MAEERPPAGNGSDPYAGGYAFGPFSDSAAGDETQPGAMPVPGETTPPQPPEAWQPIGGRGAEHTEPQGWQSPEAREAAEQTRPLPPWSPASTGTPEAMQMSGYGTAVTGLPSGDQALPETAPGPAVGAAGVGAPPGPPQGRSNRTLIMVAVVVAALVLVGVGVGIAVTSGPKPKTTSRPTATVPSGSAGNPASQSPSAAALPSDAVRGYLGALAAGDAKKAMSYGVTPPAEISLLTNAVLAESNRRAPITAISVPIVDDPNATAVGASYKIGSTEVSFNYPVVKRADQWRLVSATSRVIVDYNDVAGMKINGVKIYGEVILMFPGSYAVTASSKNLTFGKRTFVVKAVGTDVERHPTPAELTGTGKKLAVGAARKDLNRCLKTRELSPKSCPFGVRANGYTNVKSTIRWTVTGGDPFAKAKFELAQDKVAVKQISLRIRFNSSCSRGGVAYLCHADIDNVATAAVPLADSGKVQWYAVKR